MGRMAAAAVSDVLLTKLGALERGRGPLGRSSLARDWFRGDDDLEEWGDPDGSVCLLYPLGGGKDMDAREGDIASSRGSLGDASGVAGRDFDLLRDG